MSNAIKKGSRAKACEVLERQFDEAEQAFQVALGRCLEAAGRGEPVPLELLDLAIAESRRSDTLNLLRGMVETFVEPLALTMLEDDFG